MSDQGGQYFTSEPDATHRPRTVVLSLPDARFELATDAAGACPPLLPNAAG